MRKKQSGLSLIVVMVMLGVIFLMSAITAQVSLLTERASRNDRDRQIAYQAAEAALADAEIDLMGVDGTKTFTLKRCDVRSVNTGDQTPLGTNPTYFVDGCGNSTTLKTRGRCLLNESSTPLYRSIDFVVTNDTARRYALVGEFTNRTATFAVGPGTSAGVPRYIVEIVDHEPWSSTNSKPPEISGRYQAFLITGVGFGTTFDTRIVLQALIFKPTPTPGC
jgi:type IV pilus assembly protein PilX